MVRDLHDEVVDFYRRYGPTFADEEPAYAQVCARLGEYPELVDLIAAHPPPARQPNLLFAAVHFLVLGGADHRLTQVYAGRADDDPVPLFADFVLANRARVDELLATRTTQTNEVGRSAVLALVLLDAERRLSGAAPAWIDLGSSGGLNLNCDRYRIDYRTEPGGAVSPADAGSGVRSIGDRAPLTLHCQVRSGRPPIADRHAAVAWRTGVDQAPIDTTDPEQARWLHACLWPSRIDRHHRLDAAIAVAAANPPSVIEADAAAGVRQAIALAPADAPLVLTTTWVWYYLPHQTRHEVLDTLRHCGRRVLWYSLEGRGVVDEIGLGHDIDVDRSVVGVVDFDPASGDTPAGRGTVLADTHPHGTWIAWRGGDGPA